jgi:hypothetical protein
MPLDTNVSAVCSTSCWSTLQPKAFQSFQPIGGVAASPLSSAVAGVASPRSIIGTTAKTRNTSDLLVATEAKPRPENLYKQP